MPKRQSYAVLLVAALCLMAGSHAQSTNASSKPQAQTAASQPPPVTAAALQESVAALLSRTSSAVIANRSTPSSQAAVPATHTDTSNTPKQADKIAAQSSDMVVQAFSKEAPAPAARGAGRCLIAFDYDGTIEEPGGKAGADLPRVFAELSAANLPLGLTTANCNYNRVKRWLHAFAPQTWTWQLLGSSASQFCNNDKGALMLNVVSHYGTTTYCTAVIDDMPSNRYSIESRGAYYQATPALNRAATYTNYRDARAALQNRGCRC